MSFVLHMNIWKNSPQKYNTLAQLNFYLLFRVSKQPKTANPFCKFDHSAISLCSISDWTILKLPSKITSLLIKDNSGKLTFDGFLSLMASKMSEKDTKEEILKAFKLFDDDDTGKISFENLKRVANELGESLTDEELQVNWKYYPRSWITSAI